MEQGRGDFGKASTYSNIQYAYSNTKNAVRARARHAIINAKMVKGGRGIRIRMIGRMTNRILNISAKLD